MRSREEVFEKFCEMRDHKLRELKERYLSRSFMNCAHNFRFPVHGKGHVGFCQNATVLKLCRRKMFVCNDDGTAKRCKMYDCKNTDESVETLFKDILKSPSRCGESYPKLAILIWFLQGSDGVSKRERLRCLATQMWLSFWKIITFRWANGK